MSVSSRADYFNACAHGECSICQVREVSRGADTKANGWGGGTLECGDLCLVEDGSERRGARVSDEVPLETTSEGWDGDGERVGMSRARTQSKYSTIAQIRAPGGLLERLQNRVALEALGESGSSTGPKSIISQAAGRGVWVWVSSVKYGR